MKLQRGSLVERVRARENGTSAETRSNLGGWRSSTISTEEQGLNLLRDWLIGAIRTVLKPGNNYALHAWLNVHQQHGHNVSHNHPGAVLSGVYYIAVPDGSGELVLEDPRATAQFSQFEKYFRYCDDDEQSSGNLKIAPREGMLVMFPSWLRHRVESSDSSEERISLPFNVNPR